MLSRPLSALLLILVLGASGCRIGSLLFYSPLIGSVNGTSVQVEIWLPDSTPAEIRLDGLPVDLSGFTQQDSRLSGTLAGLTPGPHALEAEFPLGLLTLVDSVDFVVEPSASFSTRGSVEQVFVTQAVPGQALQLHGPDGRLYGEGEADVQGSLVFREVQPNSGYRVLGSAPSGLSDPVDVQSIAGSLPPPEFYSSQVLEPGYGYLTTRDGTQLSVFVSLPGPPEDGPYPTLVNYSGYEPSQPGSPIQVGDLDPSVICGLVPVLCNAPHHPVGLIASFLGYATVGVNMRGTGCSGGAYDFFEPLQVLDGYDLVEIVAAQDWVKHGQVGLAGLSYPGISQLFVASTRPPGLAAITPLSVISGTDTILGPGGILNDGFAIEWGQRVLDRAGPYGQGWEQGVVDSGDGVCEENQLLHSQKVDIIQKAFDNPFYVPELYDPLNPRNFVGQIDVPIFTSGQWQDEQTGGHFPDLWNRFDSAPVKRMTGTNGAHADGYTPQVLVEWKTFLDFYVAREIMPITNALRVLAPLLFQEIYGASVDLPAERYGDATDFAMARAEYEAEPDIRIIFESGAGNTPAGPGAPEGSFELSLPEWPPPSLDAQRWYLHQDGSLRPFAPAEAESASSFDHDNAKGGETYVVNDAFEKALPDIEWLPWQAGRQVVFATEPLAADLVLLGPAAADLYIQSSADDADLEVMLSEIRPDGQEVYLTSGWLRASMRKLTPESTPLRPTPTRLESDTAPLPAGQWEKVSIEIYPFAHVVRAGSRLRASVSTPGGNKGRWKFDVLQFDEPVTHSVSHSTAFASSLLLPVLPGVDAPSELPACPGLRSQPCRDYVPHTNALLP